MPKKYFLYLFLIVFSIFVYADWVLDAATFTVVTNCNNGEVLYGNGTCSNITGAADGTDNSSWSEALANTLYADISVTATDTNVTTECGDTELLLGNGTCVGEGNYLYGGSSIDLSEYTPLNGSENFTGNVTFEQDTLVYGRIYATINSVWQDLISFITTLDSDLTNLQTAVEENETQTENDNTTLTNMIQDGSYNTNATTACSNDEVLLGNGTCTSSDNFFDDTDTTIADTNATTECSNDEVLLGNATCRASDDFFDDTDTDTDYIMDYTNIAMTNDTTTFTENVTFSRDILQGDEDIRYMGDGGDVVEYFNGSCFIRKVSGGSTFEQC